MAAQEPPTKKAKTDDAPVEETAKVDEEMVEEKEAVTKTPEPPKEQEEDASADKRPKIKEKVCFLQQDCTMNVADSIHGGLLSCMTDGGLQYLLAGARANVGIKSGRYMFEVNVVELMIQKQDSTGVQGKLPQPRNFFRLGLSTADSFPVLGEDEKSVCFDAEGNFIYNKTKTQVGAKFERSMHVCVLVNLDSDSPNANTVSIFRDGQRICKPQALPESLVGEVFIQPSRTEM
jgi:hypothetical protein